MLNRTPDNLIRSINPFVTGSVGSDETPMRFPNLLGILRRQRRSVVGGVAGGGVLALLYILLSTPLYLSEADVIIDTQMNQGLQKQNIISDSALDPNLVDSEVTVISSESVVLAVIRSLKLASDPEFVGPPDALGAEILWNIKQVVTAVKNSLFTPQPDIMTKEELDERTAVDVFLKRLTAKRVDLTNVISITYASEDPLKAAKITNAVAQKYRSQELAAKFESTKLAGKWLEERLAEMRTQVSDADSAVQKYKAANAIVDTGARMLNQEQLSNLNTQLITARAATAEAKAKLDRIQQLNKDGVPDATVADALSNSVITRLRQQYLDLSAREQDLSARLGQNHVAAVKLRDQMAELRRSVLDEEKRIADSYQSNYEIAKAGEVSLTHAMSQLVGEAGTSNQAQVRMRDLESSADTYRSLYDSFLQKYQQTTQEQTIPITNVRIVTEATPPLTKSAPKTLLGLVGGLLVGFMLGAGVGLLRELSGDVFRTQSEIETGLGLPSLGILPIVEAAPKQAGLFGGLLNALPFRRRDAATARCAPSVIGQYVCDAPRSRFAETFRNIKVSLDNARIAENIKTVGVVSSVPREGKTTVAANLAAIIGGSGQRVLLIDGDFHRRSLTAMLTPDARQGVLELLASPEELPSFVQKIARTNVDVLPCVADKRLVNSTDLMGSPKMAALLEVARKHYDYIVIELAPIVPVADAKALAHSIDSFVFVVEWGVSSRSLVLEALSESEVIRQRMLGVVLNKADPEALESLEAYKGKSFKDYYLD